MYGDESRILVVMSNDLAFFLLLASHFSSHRLSYPLVNVCLKVTKWERTTIPSTKTPWNA